MHLSKLIELYSRKSVPWWKNFVLNQNHLGNQIPGRNADCDLKHLNIYNIWHNLTEGVGEKMLT